MTACFTGLIGNMMIPQAAFGVRYTTDILSVRVVDCYPVCVKFSLITHTHDKKCRLNLNIRIIPAMPVINRPTGDTGDVAKIIRKSGGQPASRNRDNEKRGSGMP